MSRSTYCILCAECIKTCPENNMTLRLRPWGSDLARPEKPRVDEALLALILLSMTAFHGLTMTPVWRTWNYHIGNASFLPGWLTFTVLMAATLLGPIALYCGVTWIAARLSGVVSGKEVFLHYAYALLPIALFYHLAHNAEHFLIESPRLLALVSDPFGWGWDLFGSAQMQFGPLMSLEGLWLLQVALVLVGHLYALWISDLTTRKLIDEPGRALRVQVPVLAIMVLFSVFSLWLLGQPMEMRVSGL
jgi:ferredoxin